MTPPIRITTMIVRANDIPEVIPETIYSVAGELGALIGTITGVAVICITGGAVLTAVAVVYAVTVGSGVGVSVIKVVTVGPGVGVSVT